MVVIETDLIVLAAALKDDFRASHDPDPEGEPPILRPMEAAAVVREETRPTPPGLEARSKEGTMYSSAADQGTDKF